MTAFKRILLSWLRQPFFRNYFLWSYRVDLFLLLIGTYLLIGGLTLIPYLYANASAYAKLQDSLADFRTNRAALLTLISKDKNLQPEDLASIEKLVLFDSRNQEIAQYKSRARDTALGFALNLPPLGPTTPAVSSGPLLEKIKDWAALKLFVIVVLRDAYTRLGSVAASPVTVILVPLPIVLMAFYIWNVFHTRDIQFVLRHPKFTILFGQLLALMVAPIAIGGFMELCSNDTMQLVSTSGVLADLPGEHTGRFVPEARLAFSNISDIATAVTSVEGGKVFISDASAILITLICWMAAGLWIVRYFGGGIFLACSTIAAVLVVLIQIAASDPPFANLVDQNSHLNFYLFTLQARGGSDFTYRLIFTICSMGLVFLIGLQVNRYKEYFLCTGFLGVMVLWCLLVSMTVEVRNVSLIAFGGALLIVVLSVGLVEFALRKSMYRFLYDPR